MKDGKTRISNSPAPVGNRKTVGWSTPHGGLTPPQRWSGVTKHKNPGRGKPVKCNHGKGKKY